MVDDVKFSVLSVGSVEKKLFALRLKPAVLNSPLILNEKLPLVTKSAASVQLPPLPFNVTLPPNELPARFIV